MKKFKSKKIINIVLLSFFIFVFPTNCLASISSNAKSSLVQLQVKTTEGSKKGSGIIISANGYMLTNYHVIEKQTEIKVCLFEEEVFIASCNQEAEVISYNSEIDIALLKIINKEKLSFLEFGSMQDLSEGDVISILGFPDSGGNLLTITTGTFSGWFEYGKYFKTDASMSAGASGGATIDSKEKIVGVNVAVSKGRDANFSLSIPIDVVKNWLVSIGFAEVNFYGTTREELMEHRKRLTNLIKEYRQRNKQQQKKVNLIKQKYVQLKNEEQQKYDDFMKILNNKRDSLKSQVDQALQTLAGYSSSSIKESETARVNKIWEDFQKAYNADKENADHVLENNLKIIEKKEKDEMIENEIIDYNQRIAQCQKGIDFIKKQLSRLLLYGHLDGQKKQSKKIKEKEDQSLLNDNLNQENSKIEDNKEELEFITLTLGKRFKNIEGLALRIQKTKKRYFLQWYLKDKNLRSKITQYQIEIKQKDKQILEKKTKKGFLLFSFQENKNYESKVIAFDKKDNIIKEIKINFVID